MLQFVILIALSAAGGSYEEVRVPVQAADIAACEQLIPQQLDAARRTFIANNHLRPGVAITTVANCWTLDEVESFR